MSSVDTKPEDVAASAQSGGPVMMVCVDGSEVAERALNRAMEYAQRLSANLLITSVYEKMDFSVFADIDSPFLAGELQAAADKRDQVLAQRLHALVDSYAETARRQGLKVNTVLHSANDVGSELIKLASKHHVNTIVVGSRGRNVVQRTLVGSTTSHLLHNSHVNVLVVQ